MGHQESRLEHLYASILTRRDTEGRLRRLTTPAPGTVDFSSNNYLSLSKDPKIKSAYISRLQSPSHEFSLGSGGSRLLDGNTPTAETLERTIAAFHGAPAGLLFNSGFDANTGLFSCAPQPGDVVVYDELIHASVHDGMRLSRARRVPFAHSIVRHKHDTAGKLKGLDEVLSGLIDGEDGEAFTAGEANIFIAIEGVYSMDGDVAPLADIVECVEEKLPNRNGYIIVDEAHSTGWLGPRGRGLVSLLGLEDRVWARIHTFGKAMGCAGAIVLCSPTVRAYLINYARSLIYSTAIGYPVLVSVQIAYDYLESGRADPRLVHLRSLMRHTRAFLASISNRRHPLKEIFHISERLHESPIIALYTSHPRSLARHCQLRGFIVRPIVAPTVPSGTDRVRLCLHAGNTVAEVRLLCEAIDAWVCEQQRSKSTRQLSRL